MPVLTHNILMKCYFGCLYFNHSKVDREFVKNGG